MVVFIVGFGGVDAGGERDARERGEFSRYHIYLLWYILGFQLYPVKN